MRYKKVSLILVLSIFYVFSLFSTPTVRIKDIAYFNGVRENQLSGIGLVTGLSGKGDSSSSNLLKNTLSNLLSFFDIRVIPADIKSKNCAVVMVNSEIPSFVRSGERIDVTVSSIGDARSLEGGMLLQTNLQGANGEIYAVAQGKILISTTSKNIKTVGRIVSGAIVEREIPSLFTYNGTIQVILRNPDFVTANAVVEAIGKVYEDINVKSKDAALIEVEVPEDKQKDLISFMAEIESLKIIPDISGKVVIDPNSGVIIIGDNVKVGKVAVSYREMSLSVGFSTFDDEDTPDKFIIEDTTTVNDLVEVLKTAGLKTDTVIGILQAIERAGALFGKLIIM